MPVVSLSFSLFVFLTAQDHSWLFRTSWSSSLALQGKPMVLFGSTMKQWLLALSLSVGPGARVFVAECDPFCDIEFVYQYVHPDTGAWFHEECVKFESKLIFISRSTNRMSQRECGHIGHVLLPWCQRFFQEVIQVFVDLKRCSRFRVPSSSFLNSDQAEQFRRSFPQCAVRAWQSVSVVTSD